MPRAKNGTPTKKGDNKTAKLKGYKEPKKTAKPKTIKTRIT